MHGDFARYPIGFAGSFAPLVKDPSPGSSTNRPTGLRCARADALEPARFALNGGGAQPTHTAEGLLKQGAVQVSIPRLVGGEEQQRPQEGKVGFHGCAATHFFGSGGRALIHARLNT